MTTRRDLGVRTGTEVKRLPLTDGAVVGRATESDICLGNDYLVGLQHARIVRGAAGWSIETDDNTFMLDEAGCEERAVGASYFRLLPPPSEEPVPPRAGDNLVELACWGLLFVLVVVIPSGLGWWDGWGTLQEAVHAVQSSHHRPDPFEAPPSSPPPVVGRPKPITPESSGRAALPSPPLVEAAASFVVASDGTGTHRTISAAVAAALGGAKILVRPGTYRETVTLTRPVTMEASSSAPTILQSGSGVPLTIRADATVKGLTIRRLTSLPTSAVVVIHSHPAFKNCTIRSDGGTGVEVASGGKATLSACTVSGCGTLGIFTHNGGACEGRFCNIDRNSGAGVRTFGAGSVVTLSSSALTGNGVGAWAEQEAMVRLIGCNLRDNRTPTIRTDGGQIDQSRTAADQ